MPEGGGRASLGDPGLRGGVAKGTQALQEGGESQAPKDGGGTPQALAPEGTGVSRGSGFRAGTFAKGMVAGVVPVVSPPVTDVTPWAYLRAVDVKILQQLVVVNEGIEAVKWLLEERSTLTSRCSSLASSQYSLVESQAASRRGSWDSLQDPNDRLDSISVGSYLDTLADDMDEYSQTAAETAAASTPGRALLRVEQDWARIDPERGLAKQEKGKAEHEWPHVDLSPPGLPQDHRFAKEPQVANGHLGQQPSSLEPGRDSKLPSGAGERLGKGNPGGKARKAEADFENCKLNSKLHLEYDAHWRWLQSQDDVTFL
ncbi:PREDICTED: leucine rich adaptor protein 1 [Haliaeetus leucocephalus]|uniref:leucine rich adaptor protein 1 n=1 Tax=Haliaeetus leucocephalus TaxID=52644 RepID=UPI00053CB738|nr:PREDICTED: leucine rich adaptor protein 1 [Haliaeetus leucocephalus]